MLKQIYENVINYFKSPTKQDGYDCAERWINEGIYTREELSNLSDGTFDYTDFDRGIREFLMDSIPEHSDVCE